MKRSAADDAALWKARPEIGLDTEKAMESLDPAEKKMFRLGARAFYLACSKALLQKLPLTNKLIMHASFLALKCENGEQEVRSLRYIAGQRQPQVIGVDQVSSVIDEWHMLKCDDERGALHINGRVDDYCTKIFSLKATTGAPKYPLFSKLIKALLSLPRSNADLERGFSENKHLLDGRSSLSIASINEMRHVRSFLQRYDGDATKVPLKADLLRCVRQSRARYTERVSSEGNTCKRKATEQPAFEQPSQEAEKKALEDQVAASKALLASAEEIISLGVKQKDINKVASGHVLLTKGNESLEQALKKLDDHTKRMAKKAKR
ncbi:hypothetical protein HPB50_028969 [Hyalomma asiaticum]|nr:hypothetical protein HPB50_028969 [Hyalomma asiaticum]